MNYATIKTNDVANGLGVRTNLFVSGCNNHCKNCFNPETWDFNYGKPFTYKERDFIIDSCRPNHIRGLSILGGEPLDPKNITDVLDLIVNFRYTLNNSKTIWIYTGFTWEELSSKMMNHDNEYYPKVLSTTFDLVDILVEGRFVEELKDLNLRFRGSSNQRIIDLNKSSIITGNFIEYNLGE